MNKKILDILVEVHMDGYQCGVVDICINDAAKQIESIYSEDFAIAAIDELRNRKGFRHWWDNCDFQDDVIECLQNRIAKAE